MRSFLFITLLAVMLFSSLTALQSNNNVKVVYFDACDYYGLFYKYEKDTEKTTFDYAGSIKMTEQITSTWTAVEIVTTKKDFTYRCKNYQDLMIKAHNQCISLFEKVPLDSQRVRSYFCWVNNSFYKITENRHVDGYRINHNTVFIDDKITQVHEFAAEIFLMFGLWLTILILFLRKGKKLGILFLFLAVFTVINAYMYASGINFSIFSFLISFVLYEIYMFYLYKSEKIKKTKETSDIEKTKETSDKDSTKVKRFNLKMPWLRRSLIIFLLASSFFSILSLIKF